MATLYADTPGQYGQMLQARRQAQANAMNRAADQSARMAFDAQRTQQNQLNQRASLFANALQARRQQEQRESELRDRARQLQEQNRAQQLFTLRRDAAQQQALKERDAAQQQALKERDQARFAADRQQAEAVARAKAEAAAQEARQKLASNELRSVTSNPEFRDEFIRNPSLFPNLNADPYLSSQAVGYARSHLLRLNKEAYEENKDQFLEDDPDLKLVDEEAKDSAVEELKRIFGENVRYNKRADTRRGMLLGPPTELTADQKELPVFVQAAKRAAAQRAAAQRAAASAAPTSRRNIGAYPYRQDIQMGASQTPDFSFDPVTGLIPFPQ